MIIHTILDKCNTIIRGSDLNTGINPVGELTYGTVNTRLLIHFPLEKIQDAITTKMMPDRSKMRHILHMTNTNGIDLMDLHCYKTSSTGGENKVRATSFDLIFFLIPMEWDRGKGFHFTETEYDLDTIRMNKVKSERMISVDGCNWYQPRNGFYWDEYGIYSTDTLEKEYNKFAEGDKSSIVIARQKFDIGVEDINVDITDVVNRYLDGELENYGIGIAFSPMLENIGNEEDTNYTLGDFLNWVNEYKKEDYMKKESLMKVLNESGMPSEFDRNIKLNNFKLDKLGYGENYVGFFTDRTNTFFEPYVETVYNDWIADDRGNFCLNKNNRLYFYSAIEGNPINLDEMPICKIVNDEGETIKLCDVKQTSTGAYYVEVMFPSDQYEENYMYYDVWDNIIYNGVRYPEMELEFVLKNASSWISLGTPMAKTASFTPSLSGIKSNEEIRRGDIRKLTIESLVNYTNNTSQNVDNVQVRVYIKDGTREVEVFPFQNANRAFNDTYVLIDTSTMVPQKYYVDVKFRYNMQEIVHHDVLNFKIVDILKNRYY